VNFGVPHAHAPGSQGDAGGLGALPSTPATWKPHEKFTSKIDWIEKKHSIERDIYIYIYTYISWGISWDVLWNIMDALWMHYGCIMDVHSLIPLQNATA